MSNQSEADAAATLGRAIRVSDQSCTGYALLRDRYKRWALILDITILLVSAWLTAMVFVQPAIAIQLSPSNIPKDLWLGLLSIGAFGLSLIQLQVNWKGRAEAYQQASAVLSSFVKESRPLIESTDPHAIRLALVRYQAVTESIEPIPESKFLLLKQRHKLKIELSRHLDTYPATSLRLLKVTLWWRDNKSFFGFKSEKKDSSQ